MSTTYMAPVIGDMSRWHDPANDCPNRAAFLDQLLGRKPVKAPEPVTPETRKCKRPGCMVALTYHKRASAEYCSEACGWNHRKSIRGGERTKGILKHSGQCRKCGTPRPAGERCPKCQAATKQRSNAVQRAKAAKAAHPAILPSTLDAVEQVCS